MYNYLSLFSYYATMGTSISIAKKLTKSLPVLVVHTSWLILACKNQLLNFQELYMLAIIENSLLKVKLYALTTK